MRSIPIEEETIIDDMVDERVRMIWTDDNMCLTRATCDSCAAKHLNVGIRQLCIGDMATLRYTCAACWAHDYKESLVKEWLLKQSKKLDVEDFSKI
jgi:hypothetical protein